MPCPVGFERSHFSLLLGISTSVPTSICGRCRAYAHTTRASVKRCHVTANVVSTRMIGPPRRRPDEARHADLTRSVTPQGRQAGGGMPAASS